MNISYENKVALVTGAGSGLGLATAKAFAESGASVVLADWNEEAVRSAAKGLAAQGHKALAIRCDVADDAQVEAMVEQTVATFGRLDAAYNNAGVQNVLAETADYPREDYDRVMAINLRGVWSSNFVRCASKAAARSSTVLPLEGSLAVPSGQATTPPNME
jgi:NAD(P)-dependent dehydrogenase (short-subunit alcohol dehydrogenase family)